MSDPEIKSARIRANGLRFHVDTCGEGERLALCLHGFPELGYSWRYQLPLLARLGYRAWAPDLRGYGQSDRPLALIDYSLEPLMEDVGGLIEASGAKSVTLLAHDWGAIIAWFYAMRNPGALERLVIMNVPHPAAARDQRSWRQLRRSWYILFFQIPGLPEAALRARDGQGVTDAFRNMAVDKSRFPSEVTEVYRKAALVPGALTAMINYYRGLLRGGSMRRQQALGYPTIEVPTLMVWGEEDAALGKELTYGTDRYVKDLTVRYLPGVSHWVQQEAPETVNAMLEAWLLGQPVPEAAN